MGLVISVIFVCDKCRKSVLKEFEETGTFYSDYYYNPGSIAGWTDSMMRNDMVYRATREYGVHDPIDLRCPECTKERMEEILPKGWEETLPKG